MDLSTTLVSTCMSARVLKQNLSCYHTFKDALKSGVVASVRSHEGKYQEQTRFTEQCNIQRKKIPFSLKLQNDFCKT